MATPFRLKRSAIEGKRPAESDLQRGELALNTYDGYLYTEREGVGLSTVTNLTPWYENYGGGSIYYSNSVGIGTTVPQYNLDVRKGSIGGYDTLVAQHSDIIKEIAVTVAAKTDDHRYQGQGSSNGYVLDGIQSPILTLTPGRTYKFNLSSSDMSSHPFRFYLDEAKTVQYTTNVTTTSTSAQITITDSTPNMLHYQCSSHGYMGNALIINSNVVNSPYAAIIRNGLDVLSGNVDISSNLDVDGDTTLDITTIDGLLDINAGGQANTFKVEDLTAGRVVIAGTGGELEDNSNLTFNGTDLSAASLIVSDLTDGRVVLAGGSGAVQDNANLKFNTTTSEFEVVGHTVLDSVVTSGIATIGGDAVVNGNLTIESVAPNLIFTDTNHNSDFKIFVNAGVFSVRDETNGADRFQVASDGTTTVAQNLDVGAGIDITGNATISNNATISGDLTVTGNVGIAGTLTYEDVSRVDAVGLSTFREGLFIPDGQKAQFGNAAGSADLNIYHASNNNVISSQANGGNGILKVLIDNRVDFKNISDNETIAKFNESGSCELYFNNSKKIETTQNGVTVTGSIVAGSAKVSDLTSGRVVLAGASGEIEDSANLKFTGSDLIVGTGVTANNTGVIVSGVTTSISFVGPLTGNADTATDLAINGTNQLLYQASNNDSAVLPTGNAGQILQSNGSGSAPQWVTSAPAGAIEGITIRDDSSIVGSANSISTINFVGNGVVADAAVAAGIATVTINAGVAVSEGSGTKATGAIGLDFTGPVISVDAVSNTGIATVRVEGLSIKDEGSTVGTAGSITTINFVGAGIAAAVSGDTATVTSAGGATTDDVVALAIALG